MNMLDTVRTLSTATTEAAESVAETVMENAAESGQGWLEMIKEMIANADPSRFVDSLSYMGVGMLGIFLVMGILIVGTAALNAVMNAIAKRGSKKD